ncbi:MAG TPA: glycosyltransferase [Steroidobacteraceae bacterium]|nr:glycosyltransferase [Steroidobacteraceae bacterium]
MKTAIIFRQQLFKRSEPFIVQQAEHLQRYRPVYVGRERLGEAPADAQVIALSDAPHGYRRARKLWLAASRDSGPYARALRGSAPALIHAHFGVDAVYALPLARRLGVPLVTTFHGFDATLSTAALIASRSPSWLNYALFRRQLAREGHLFLCVSEFIRARVQALGFPPERTRVHYIGIDVQSIRPREAAEEEPVILHVARLVEKKGTQYLLRAFAGCAQRHPRFRLVIIGEGPLRRALESLATRLSLGERAQFLGALPHEEVMRWIRSASVLALPSVRASTGDAEGLGMVLLEAAAHGVPVVASRHGGIPEAVVDGKSGYLVGERDVAALSHRLDELMRDGSLRRQMGAQGRAWTEERLDIRTQSASLESLYDEVVQCPGRS